jgi:hypothetical protein
VSPLWWDSTPVRLRDHGGTWRHRRKHGAVPNRVNGSGITALAVLVFLQLATEMVVSPERPVPQADGGHSAFPVYEGQFLPAALKRKHVAETAVYAAIRAQGIEDISRVEAVILKASVSSSVFSRNTVGSGTALDDVDRGTSGDHSGMLDFPERKHGSSSPKSAPSRRERNAPARRRAGYATCRGGERLARKRSRRTLG